MGQLGDGLVVGQKLNGECARCQLLEYRLQVFPQVSFLYFPGVAPQVKISAGTLTRADEPLDSRHEVPGGKRRPQESCAIAAEPAPRETKQDTIPGEQGGVQ